MFTGLHSHTCSPAAVPPNVEKLFTNTNGTKCFRSRNLTTANHTAAPKLTQFLFNLQFGENPFFFFCQTHPSPNWLILKVASTPLTVLVHIIHTEGIMSSSGVEAQLVPKCSTVVLIKLDNNQGFFPPRAFEQPPSLHLVS